MKKSMVGANHDSIKDWGLRVFVNIFKQARQPGLPAHPHEQVGQLGSGPNGYPPGDFGQILWTEGAHPHGEYVLTGEAVMFTDIKFPLKNATIISKMFEGGKIRVHLKVTGGSTFSIGMYGFGWKNLDFRQIEYENSRAIFNPIWFEMVIKSGVDMHRFMDLQKTNRDKNKRPDGSWVVPDVKSFAERSKPEDFTYTGLTGVPLEILVLLLADIEKTKGVPPDGWFCAPVLWGWDDFVAMAAVIKDTAKAVGWSGFVLTEYSNEYWNGQFRQYDSNQNAAMVDPMFAGIANVFYRGRARGGYMACLLGKAFKEVFAETPERIRPILSGHAFDPSKMQVTLNWLRSEKPDHLTVIWGLAIAPYFGNSQMMERDDLVVDDFFDKPYTTVVDGKAVQGANYMMDRAARMQESFVTQFLAQCKQHEKMPCMYEFGKDFGYAKIDPEGPEPKRATSQVAKIAASLDERMYQPICLNITLWFEQGGGPCAYFVLASRYSDFQWGATDDITNLERPIFRALRDSALQYIWPEPPVKIDLTGVRLADGAKFPLTGALDMVGSTIEAVISDGDRVRFVISQEGQVKHSLLEKQKPFRLFGDTTPWNLPNGPYQGEVIAYRGDTELGRTTVSITVGEDELAKLRKELETVKKDLETRTAQHNELLRQVGLKDGQIKDLEVQVETARTAYTTLVDKIRGVLP